MNNSERSNRFEVAVHSLRDLYDNEITTTLIDLLTDAMHWCYLNADDFHFTFAQACRHFIHELNGEQTDERRMP